MTDPQQFLIYQSEDGITRVDVRLQEQTLWLSQKQLTELFGKAKGTISEHIKHIFEDGELTPTATVRLFRTVQTEGGREVSREVEHYNLDMVLALGFRVRSPVAVRFRQWAGDKLKEYMGLAQLFFQNFAGVWNSFKAGAAAAGVGGVAPDAAGAAGGPAEAAGVGAATPVEGVGSAL